MTEATATKTATNRKIKLNPFRLLAESWKQYRKSFMRLWLVAVVVAVPANLLRLTSQSATIDLSYIGSIAALFMLIALLLLILGKEQKADQSLVALYNQASASFLRYVGLTLVEAIIAIPLALSFVLLVVALGIRFDMWQLLSIASLVAMVFFAFIFTRFSLSPYILIDQQLSVWKSLRASWRITKKRFWKIFAGYIVILALVLIVSGVVIELSNFLPFISQNDLGNALVSGLVASLLLPYLLVYVGKIYAKASQ